MGVAEISVRGDAELYGGECLTQRRKDARAQREAPTGPADFLGAFASSRGGLLKAEAKRSSDRGRNHGTSASPTDRCEPCASGQKDSRNVDSRSPRFTTAPSPIPPR